MEDLARLDSVWDNLRSTSRSIFLGKWRYQSSRVVKVGDRLWVLRLLACT